MFTKFLKPMMVSVCFEGITGIIFIDDVLVIKCDASIYAIYLLHHQVTFLNYWALE